MPNINAILLAQLEQIERKLKLKKIFIKYHDVFKHFRGAKLFSDLNFIKVIISYKLYYSIKSFKVQK